MLGCTAAQNVDSVCASILFLFFFSKFLFLYEEFYLYLFSSVLSLSFLFFPNSFLYTMFFIWDSFLLNVNVPNYILYTKRFIWNSFLLDVHVPNYILYTKCFIWDSFLLDVHMPNNIRLIRKKMYSYLFVYSVFV